MKIRIGFVSNSSSSSFTCDLCGEEFCGMDLSVTDVDHLVCEHGHIFCKDKVVGIPEDTYWSAYCSDNDIPSYEEVEEKYCPICNMKHVAPKEAIDYLFRRERTTIKAVQKEIKDRFPSYEDFKKYMGK